ncbi:hypothetical protein [Microvirga mediterraneensis]|uniref:Uncharacterized protein n=1 Tax=Microvirga mediterraneensis TaxID=2754695 RepID=A0A838BT20_9HYPH|nr:hypothetical protein [Microvirga mediterraneensis]MBA1158172.1 hypothetical protein [Microvirga mediterraneensis]
MKISRESGVAASVRRALYVLAVLPAVYVFVVIQYSAITLPFWDHTELIRWIAAWHDGTFTFASLLAPHNHTRPLVYRGVMLANAILTAWDLRSEYIYMYVAIFGTFACHWWGLKRLIPSNDGLVLPAAMLVVSIFIFSPAGHNNHWWSMMFQLNATNALIALALLVIFTNPGKWLNHVIGAISCWLAAYCLTNGLVAFIAIIITLQFGSHSLWRPSKWVLFWVINFAVVLLTYVPGMSGSMESAHPGVVDLIRFTFVYLGAPLGSLIWFPFKNQFDVPASTMFNGICGFALVGTGCFWVWRAWDDLRSGRPPALILVGFALFAGGSAIVTGWGRAGFDAAGVSNANASRYTIFGVYLLLGQVYYVAHLMAQRKALRAPSQPRRLHWSSLAASLAVSATVLLGSITYYRAIRIYQDVRFFSAELATAYPIGLEPTPRDGFIHPSPEFVRQLKADLQRLKIGPYRER